MSGCKVPCKRVLCLCHAEGFSLGYQGGAEDERRNAATLLRMWAAMTYDQSYGPEADIQTSGRRFYIELAAALRTAADMIEPPEDEEAP